MKKRIPNDFRCNICNKLYSTRQNLWKHNQKFHNNNDCEKTATDCEKTVVDCEKTANDCEITQKPSIFIQNNSENIIKCCFCNKIFTRRNNLNVHIKKSCKQKKINAVEQDKEKQFMMNEINNMKNQLTQLLNEKAKIHPKKLQKINNTLINNSNNTTINNNTIIKFGKIPFSVLNTREILSILTKPFMSIETSIKKLHFSDTLPQFHNIYITNLRDNNIYVFDGIKFACLQKNEVILDLITNCVEEIETSFADLKEKMSPFWASRLKAFIELINNEDDKFIDDDNKSHKNYKNFKIQDIKRLIYDNSNETHRTLVNKLINNTDNAEIVL